MPEISIIVDNCSGQNKNNVTIRFMNMIKEGGLFGIATFNFYIKGHIKMSVIVYLPALSCCAISKMFLLLRSAVKF